MRTICGIAIVCGFGEATAGVITLDNGLVGDNHVRVASDDFGAYGEQLSPQNTDRFSPPGKSFFGASQLAGVFVFVETPDGKRSASLLAGDISWKKLVEPAEGNQADGVDRSEHTGLQRVVTTMNSQMGSAGSHSVFVLEDPTATPPWKLTFDLTQTMTFDASTATTELRQTYQITNTGQTELTELVFNAHWDGNLIWDNGFPADIVGVGNGLCYVYTRDNGGDPKQALSLADGGSTIPIASYYGGKTGLTPPGGPPAYTVKDDRIFTSFGTPVTWRNTISQLDYNVVGETDTSEADPMMGLEWRFPLAMGGSQTVVLRRVYGTSVQTCPGGTSCGNGVVDAVDEECDDGMQDSAECVALSCKSSRCGDGYVNAMALEQCEPDGIGLASATCNSDCTVSACGDGKLNPMAQEACDDGGESADCNVDCTMATCGDGIVNATREEECEAGELCDLTTCKFDFELGGGCAGCTARTPDGSWIFGAMTLGVVLGYRCKRRGQRRRYN